MLVNCSKVTAERWETSNKPIVGPICLLLKMLDRYSEYITTLKIPEKSTPVRFWYMHNETVCTLIDVNDMKKEVSVKNYTDNLMFRAFGVEEKPDYQKR